jgi:hypothetical protein
MGSVADDQRGAAAGVNNTTRELGGTLGVAVFGSIFASAYGPKIINAFRSLPIPAGPKAEAHQSVAAGLAVAGHAPAAARPALETTIFTAFHSGLEVACIAGAGVAVLGALAAFKLLPGRGAPEVQVALEGQVESLPASALVLASPPFAGVDRYPEYVPYVSA